MCAPERPPSLAGGEQRLQQANAFGAGSRSPNTPLKTHCTLLVLCSLTVRMCGIIGIFKHSGNVNVELYEGLLMLQHRGQDSAGMVTTDGMK